ncbi:MAG: DUF4836 family protein [Bacteroidota bacterium]
MNIQKSASASGIRYLSKGLSLLSLSLLLCLVACSKKEADLYHIPQESDFVVAVNMQSLALKALNFRDLLNFDLFSKKDSSSTEAALAERIQHAGIDFLSTAYLFGEMAEPNQMGEIRDSLNVTLLVSLKDADQFEAFLKQEKGIIGKEEGGLKFCANDSLLVGWNKTRAFITWKKDSATTSLRKKLIDLQNLPSDRSLVEKNNHFSDLRKKSFDVLFWVNGAKIEKSSPGRRSLAALKDNYMGSVLNFEKGEVVCEGNFVSNNPAINKYTDLMDQKIGKELVNTIPTPSPIAALALKLNLKTVKRMLQDNNMLSSASPMLQMLGLSTDEILDMLSGELVVSVINLPDSGQYIPEMYVSLGIANSASLKKLVGNFKNQGLLVEQGRYLGIVMMPNLAVIPQDKQLILTTATATQRNNILAGKGGNLSEKTATALQNGAFSFYFDYNILVTNSPAVSKDPEFQLLGQYLQGLEASSIQSSASTFDSKFVVTLKDKSQNSLVSLIKMSKEMDVLQKKRTEERKEKEASTTEAETSDIDSTQVQ